MQAGRSVGAKCDIAIDDAVTHADVLDVVADQCFIVARLTHDDVLEPQDFGRTIFVNTGDSLSGWHDISPSKRQRSSFAWQLVEDGRGRCDLPQGGGPAAAASKA